MSDADRYVGLPVSLTGTGELVGTAEDRTFGASIPHGHGPAGLTRFRVLALTWTCSREGLICSGLSPVTRGEQYSTLGAFSLGLRGRWVLPRSTGVMESQLAVLSVCNRSAGPIRLMATMWLKALPPPADLHDLFPR